MVGMGITLTNAKSIAPKSNFFILLPPANIAVVLFQLSWFPSSGIKAARPFSTRMLNEKA
jgi:hypothetical protein